MANVSSFWDVYTTALKQSLAPGIPLPKDNQIFALPFTVPFTLATSALPDEAVNNLLYKLANSTLAADGSQGKYADELNIYLKNVNESALIDPKAKAEYEKAERTLKDAKQNFDNVEEKAKAVYDELPEPKDSFEIWVALKYPPYGVAKAAWQAAQGARNVAYNKYRGRLDDLHKAQEKLTKAIDTQAEQPPLNMPVTGHEGDATFKPKFSSFRLKNQLNDWIVKGVGGNERVFCELKVDSAGPPSSPKGGIFVKLTTKGIAKLDVSPGQWSIPDVKTLYPNQISGAPKVLDTKYARPISYVIAYAPKLEVEIRDDQNQVQSESSAATDTQPYVTVLGVLGQHFPPK